MNDADNWPPDDDGQDVQPRPDAYLSCGCLVFAVASWGLLGWLAWELWSLCR